MDISNTDSDHKTFYVMTLREPLVTITSYHKPRVEGDYPQYGSKFKPQNSILIKQT